MAQLRRQSPRSTLRRMVAPGRPGLLQPVLTPAMAEHFMYLLAPFSVRSTDKSSWEAVARSPLGTGADGTHGKEAASSCTANRGRQSQQKIHFLMKR